MHSRSPFTLLRLLHAANLPIPEVRSGDAELPDYCRWLRKPLAGSAGFGIRFVDRPSTEENDRFYHQEFIPGTPMSASYVALRDGTRLLGVTEQLIGESWLNAPAFRYCGNIGPIHLSSTARDTLILIGEVIALGCGLRGLFGIDFMLRDEIPWLVEVNPRYTASMEILERFSDVPYLALHRAAFESIDLTSLSWPYGGFGFVGKAILYAPSPLKFPDDGPWIHSITQPLDWISLSDFADIPKPGDEIEEGWPVMTLFARGESVLDCRKRLQERTKELKRIFGWGED
jgi:uncharacterized protein